MSSWKIWRGGSFQQKLVHSNAQKPIQAGKAGRAQAPWTWGRDGQKNGDWLRVIRSPQVSPPS